MSKVLIVDDEPHLRLLYETELRRAGFETMTAATRPRVWNSWRP